MIRLNNKYLKYTSMVLIYLLNFNCNVNSQNSNNEVKVAGAMMNVMKKGELFGTIDLDTISNKEHLYGLGPAEYLQGELLIIDGRSYKSTVINNSEMSVEETFSAKAPFFVYANVPGWDEINLPDSVSDVKQLEIFLDKITEKSKRPFAFRLSGIVDSADIHIENLPAGTEVHSPEDAHTGQTDYKLNNEQAEIIGFFSTEHKGIFTHHDTYLHMHLISDDLKKMGHIDKFSLKKGAVKLFLPLD